ncbi:MAG: histidinol-phosphate transaminase [Gammaproteobacteria bacterium]|nr:histidinol-phosphate transaminase [Gammaproteobacteria bacterium]
MTNVHHGIANLRAYAPGKPIDELARELGISDIVKLASNENPRGPSDAVRAVVREAIETLSRYPDGSGYALKQSLAKYLGVDENQITLGNGSNDVIDLITRVTVEPGYEAIVAEHSFVAYRLSVACSGGTLVSVPAFQYGTDLDGFIAAVNEKTRTVFIANPNNPTGTWIAEAELVKFLDALPAHIWVVVDEAYFEFSGEEAYPNTLAMLERYENLIVTRTFSKVYGLAALRIGYGICSPYFADLLNRARLPFNVNSLALCAAETALADRSFVQQSIALNSQGKQQLIDGFNKLGLEYIPSLGNFLSVDCGQSAEPLFQALLHKGVIVRPISEYNLPQHLRVSIGLAEENERFLLAFREVLGEVLG